MSRTRPAGRIGACLFGDLIDGLAGVVGDLLLLVGAQVPVRSPELSHLVAMG
jgi:hypothetical protein